MKEFKRIPKHIGIIPDGNRRWATSNNLEKHEGYFKGVKAGVKLLEDLIDLGVEEVTFYGFTKDNAKRPKIQTESYIEACLRSIEASEELGANILVVGDTTSKVFPKEALKYLERQEKQGIKVNFLLNYDWQWDLKNIKQSKEKVLNQLHSKNISRIDLIVRWGDRIRLSGFLPVQSVYADFYCISEMWPDYNRNHLVKALKYYENTDITLGG